MPPSSLPSGMAPLAPADMSWAEAEAWGQSTALLDPPLARSGAPYAGTAAAAPAASETPRRRRPSAVILLFIPPEAQGAPARLLFMRRSTTVGSHKGQIGLAGGRAEADDASPRATALRELEEELGIPAGRVTVAGMLPPAFALDGHRVYPVVGAAAVDLSDLKPEPAEVDSVFADPWPCFTPGAGSEFRFNIFGNWRTSRLFAAPGGGVWGLTAKILHSAALA